MTFGYADKLAYREDLGGSLGDPELEEPKASLEAKVEQLATLVRSVHPSTHAAQCSHSTFSYDSRRMRLTCLRMQIRDSKKIAAFTGAGISKAAGGHWHHRHVFDVSSFLFQTVTFFHLLSEQAFRTSEAPLASGPCSEQGCRSPSLTLSLAPRSRPSPTR